MGLGDGMPKDRELSGVMIPRQAGFGCQQHHPCTGSMTAEKEQTAESWQNAFHYLVFTKYGSRCRCLVGNSLSWSRNTIKAPLLYQPHSHLFKWLLFLIVTRLKQDALRVYWIKIFSNYDQDSEGDLILPSRHDSGGIGQSWHLKNSMVGHPWWSSGQDSALPMQGTWVRSLVRKLDPTWYN